MLGPERTLTLAAFTFSAALATGASLAQAHGGGGGGGMSGGGHASAAAHLAPMSGPMFGTSRPTGGAGATGMPGAGTRGFATPGMALDPGSNGSAPLNPATRRPPVPVTTTEPVTSNIPTPVTQETPSTGPSTTLPHVQELAPLPQPIPPLPEQFSTGGSSGVNLALSPGQSSPGGGGKSLAACMGFWDRATHMSKTEWRAACLRTMEENPSVAR